MPAEAIDPLAAFSVPTRAWFRGAFEAPTDAQAGAWDAISRGESALVVAPTGSGKTLAAFLWSIDKLAASAPPEDPKHRCRVLYVSPLKALAVDVERNLRTPLTGIRQAAMRMKQPPPDLTVGLRSGDTPADQRRRLAAKPPDILITTPESLFLMLTSQARESLRGVETVIVDEVHAVAATKRGAHLALSLERLDALLPAPAQRIGLSATVRPVEEVAAFLGGTRPVTVVAPPSPKTVELEVIVPVEDMTALDEGSDDPVRRSSIWPAVEERIVSLVEQHGSTIVFANSRRLAERLTGKLNEIADAEIARAHHGSVSKEQRAIVEEELKAGRLPAVVATSSLELGIDMGAVDLVVQVESPPSVASGLQRIGRAGHQVGAVSKGVLFPKYRGDLVQTAVVAERMRAAQIEALRYPRNPLDVLAQQIVAMVAVDDWPVDELLTVVRRAAPFATLPQSAFEATLDMLAGRYPSDDFAELRPRVVWDRVSNTVTARPGAGRLAVTSGGTIPDRGLFGVFLVGEKQFRVGELDEEMVYESRVGEVFTLGTSSWRIEEITHDRVLVSPAPGQPGKLPFWHGDAPGRPVELGRAIGAFLREIAKLPSADAKRRVMSTGLDDWAADNLLSYLGEQTQATGRLPDDRTIVVERFRDELGDWRIAVHTPYGAPVHAPWALALTARLRERYGVDVQSMHSDDGIVLRIPNAEEAPSGDIAVFATDEIEAIVEAEVGASALFASRFRECAARALLLPRRRPDRRTPLWQQRQRSAQLLSVASRFPDFPIVLETMRECLQDVFDVPGLVQLMRHIEARSVHVVEVETAEPSPFARSLLFGYVAAFMYEGDAPLAERRAQALTLDPRLLAELLGRAELRELLDAAAIDGVERELQRLTDERKATDVEGVADLLRILGDLSTAEALDRGATPRWLAELEEHRRAIRVRIASEERWVPIEDAGRLRDALGTALPVGVPEAFLELVSDPLGDLISRYARTHGPFQAEDVAARLGLGVAVVHEGLRRLTTAGRIVNGEFRPDAAGEEWCDAEVLRALRRKSLAKLRKEVEPVPPAALARFVPVWQQVGPAGASGRDALLHAVDQLQGAVVPASSLEQLVLPVRVMHYESSHLDSMTSAGEVLWAGHGRLTGGDGWIALYAADTAPLLLPEPVTDAVATPLHEDVLAALDGGAAMFFRALSDRLHSTDDIKLSDVLWDLVWGGWLTNDTLAPMRAMLRGGRSRLRVPPSAYPGYVPGGRMPRRPWRAAPMPARNGPPICAGRWSRLPQRELDATVRAHALASSLLERYGVLTRGSVVAERVPGGFAATYPVLKAMEEQGSIRRGYFVEGLGGAQFAVPGAVDRLRALQQSRDVAPTPVGWQTPVPGGWRDAKQTGPDALVLAATDPANPYGAALSWPDRDQPGGHRPGRKAGALVVLIDGVLVLYVERGGKSLLSFTDDMDVLRPAVDALALAVREGSLGRLAVERADGAAILDSPLAEALEAAGFRPTPRGLRLRR
ncbi:MAG: DEAD/DEAH box helicase [Actinomycetes bacterium]